MAIKDCIAKAKEALPNFSGRELRNYISQIYTTAKEKGIPKALIQQSMKEITDDINEKTIQRYNAMAQVKLNNIAKVKGINSRIKAGKANVRELWGHTNRSLAFNAESYQKFGAQLLGDKAYGNIDPKMLRYFIDPKNDDEISKCLDGKKGSPEAEFLANNIKQYIPYRNSLMVKSDAMLSMDLSEDRFLGNNHNVSKMISGGRSLVQRAMSGFKSAKSYSKDRWVQFIKSKLHLEDTFKNSDLDTGVWQLDTAQSEPELKLDMAKVDEALGNIYDNITTSKSEIMTRSAATSDLDAIEKKSHMFFKFKDNQSWNDYNKEYGSGSIFTALKADVDASGNKSGLANFCGDNSASAYTSMRSTQLNMKNKPEKGPMKSRNSGWWHNTDNMYNDRIGKHKTVVSPTATHFIANLNAYTMMARLGSLLPQSLTDTNMAASYARRCGENYLSAFMKQWKNIATQYSDDDMKNMAAQHHMNIKAHIGFIGRFSDGENLGALTSKVSTMYYKLNFMHGWDGGNRTGIMLGQAKHLGDMAKLGLNELPKSAQYMLNKFDISSPEWDALRSNLNSGLLSTESASTLSDETVKDLQAKMGITDQSIADTKNDLYRKLYSYFDVASENAILTPGTFERACMLQGTSAGTPVGSFLRLVMQFKGWPLSYINRQLINGFRDADATQAKLGWALTTFGAVLPLSILASALYYISQGQTMPDPEKMTGEQQTEFWAEMAMPGLGVMANILDPQNQNRNLLSSLAMTPNWRTLNDAISTPLATVTGNFKGAGKDLKDALQYAVPGMTYPLIGPLVKEALGYHPYLQPGQQQLYGA